MPRKRLPLASPTSIRRLWPARTTASAASGSVGDAEHPGEVVAAAAGDDPQRRLGARHRAADRADQPVAAHHHRQLAAVDRAQRLLDAVLEALGALRRGSRRGRRRAPPRPAAASFSARPPRRVRVDEQGQWHPPGLHAVCSLIGVRPASTGGRRRSCRRRPRRPAARSRPRQAPAQSQPAARAARRARRRVWARIRWPPGRSTRAASAGSGRASTPATQVEWSSGKGSERGRARLKATRPSGSRPTRAVARRTAAVERRRRAPGPRGTRGRGRAPPRRRRTRPRGRARARRRAGRRRRAGSAAGRGTDRS